MKLVRWPPSAVKRENNSPVQVHKSPLFTGSRKNKPTFPTSIAARGKVHPCKIAPFSRGRLGHPMRAGLVPFSGSSPSPQPPKYICSHLLLSLSPYRPVFQNKTKQRVLKQQVNIAGIFLNCTFSSQKLLKYCYVSRQSELAGRVGESRRLPKLPLKNKTSFYAWVFLFI